jgi:hypothetical protein
MNKQQAIKNVHTRFTVFVELILHAACKIYHLKTWMRRLLRDLKIGKKELQSAALELST